MLKLENHLGVIEISEEYFANLIGHAVSECFGVAGMVSSGRRPGTAFCSLQRGIHR